MRKSGKRLLAMGLATTMALTGLAGCSSDSSSSVDTTANAENTSAGSDDETTAENAETTTEDDGKFHSPNYDPTYVPEEPVTIEIFSQVANYAGEQKGWSAKVLKDKFNVVVNIVQDPDGSQMTARMQSGNLGDIVVMGSRDDNYETAAKNGYLLNWNKDDLLSTYGSYMKEHFSDALEYNASMNDGVCYGYTGAVALEGSSNEQGTLYTWDTRWDLYDQLGQPEVKDLDGLLKLMKDMKEICPTDENGKETYALSMWPDWDGNMVMYVKAFATAYYGYDEWGFGLYDVTTGKLHGALEADGPYYQSLKFINKLYQEGLVDPNSMSQTYQQMAEKMKAGGVFFSIFNYAGSAIFNTEDHIADNKMMMALIPQEATPIVYGTSTTGNGYEWCIGASTQYPELCMEIINWLSTPEGYLTYCYGPEGKDGCWYYDEEGRLFLTEFGKKAQADKENTDMSEIGYTGTFNDGSLQVNSNTWAQSSINPDSPFGEAFLQTLWDSNQLEPLCDVEAKWRAYSGETLGTSYLLHWKNAIMAPPTGVSHKDPGKKDKLKTSWSAVSGEIVAGTWKCIYAKDDAEFDKLFNDMLKAAQSYGYDDCIKWSEEQAATRHEVEEIMMD